MSIDRRSFVGGMAGLPLIGLPNLSRHLLRGPRRVIFVWLDGGMTHLDTFDGKPEAPPDIRGDLKTRRTKVDGVFFSEHLPKLAARMDKMVLLRSVTHGEGNHDRGSHYLLTGHRPSAVLQHPGLGAVLSSQVDAALPAYVAIPDAPAHGRHGFLPVHTGPFEVGGSPGQPGFRVRNLAPRQRTSEGMRLLAELDKLDGSPRSADELARDRFLQKARSMSLDPKVREVFDLNREPAELRKKYGPKGLGQSLLLARRLVAAGSRAVLVRDRGWDHHTNIRRALTYGFPPKLPAIDNGLSALLDDLQRTDLFGDVLVVVASEFGRTPRLNPRGGRDHWPRAQSVLMFGAGLRPGIVVGKTDRKGEEPAERPLSPADVHATIAAALGCELDDVLRTRDGRPVQRIEVGGKPVTEALRDA